jgi:type IV secretory pathway VirB6-like protein
MTPLIASQGDEAIAPINFKHLSIGWMIGFLFAVSFIGLFLSLILKKVIILMIIFN